MRLFRKIRENLQALCMAFLVFLLVLLFGVFVVVMCFEPRWIFDLLGLSRAEVPETVARNSKYDVLKFIGISMGGVLIALQAVIANRRAKAMEDTAKAQADAAKAQAGATEEQAKANRYTEQGQRQERLKNAIEHLGHESDSVRMGGAYELFHLARDAQDPDAKELRQTVLDILCAHIRRTTRERSYRRKYDSKPSVEVQSLLTLLFMRQHEIFKGHHIDLQGSCLQGANLAEAHLQEADLSRVNLQGADLSWANLQGADLRQAHLQGSDFREAHLQGADLREVHMQAAYLPEANLHGVDLREAHLQAADLAGVCLQGADLDGANLCGAISTSEVSFSSAFHLSSFTDHIERLIGQDSDLAGVTFEGGLNQEDLDALVEGLSDDKANELREKLILHVDTPESNKLPKRHRAIIGAYTAEEAAKWIDEYKDAVSEALEER